MKRLLLPILTVYLLTVGSLTAQEMIINLKGDTGTEQAAKLELIRILQERLNKLTVAQLNSRIVVSKGVTNYYKVEEIFKMEKGIYGYRSKYATISLDLEKNNPGFSAHAGNGFGYKYLLELNGAVMKADVIKKQLQTVVESGKPIMMPAMPTFNISPAAADPGAEVAQVMSSLMSSYGVNSQADFDNLPADKQAELKGKMDGLAQQFKDAISKSVKDSNKQTLSIIGNVIGSVFGVPGAGNMVAGLFSGGGAGALAGLVGSIVDQFQIPTDYYTSETLKLTDAERLKIIDELHIRMSELYQQVSALGASLKNETKTRYNELSQPRNDQILYGPKK